MEELKFLAIENIFEEVREEVLYIKMKHLVIRTGRWTGNDGKVHPGNHVAIGKDHSIFSLIKGKVHFKRSKANRTFVSVIPS